LNGRDAAFPWRKTVQRRLFRFCIVYYCTRILKENKETPDASARFGIGKPMLIVSRFYHIDRQSAVKIVAASGHLEVNNRRNCTFSAPLVPLAGGEVDRSSLPKNPTPPRPFRPRLTIALPCRKSCGRPWLAENWGPPRPQPRTAPARSITR